MFMCRYIPIYICNISVSFPDATANMRCIYIYIVHTYSLTRFRRFQISFLITLDVRLRVLCVVTTAENHNLSYYKFFIYYTQIIYVYTLHIILYCIIMMKKKMILQHCIKRYNIIIIS